MAPEPPESAALSAPHRAALTSLRQGCGGPPELQPRRKGPPLRNFARGSKRSTGSQRGIALLAAVLTTLLVSALTAALVLITTSESYTTSAFGAAQQTLYAAESALEWAVAALPASGADWPAVAAGSVASAFVDGPPTGVRALGDGTSIDLDRVASDHPGWHTYAYGRLDGLLPELNRGSPGYVVVLVTADGGAADRMKIRALSFGPRGAHAALDARVVRVGSGAALESWRR